MVSTACPETQFNVWIAENKRSASLHMVNYKVDLMRDHVTPQQQVRVSVTLPEALEPIDRVTLIAPGEPDIGLTFRMEGRTISFKIPELRVWAMVVFSSGQEQEAATALTNARKQIRKHVVMQRDTGDWISRYESAFELYTQRDYAEALNAASRLIKDATPRW